MPQTDIGPGETPTAALGRLAAELGLALRSASCLGSARHIFSHRKLTLEVWQVSATGQPATGTYARIDWGRADRAFSTCAEKALALTAQTALLAAE